MVRPPAKTRSSALAGGALKRVANPAPARWLGTATWIGALIVSLVVAGWGYWRLRYPQPAPDEIWQRAQQNFLAGRYQEVATDLDRLERLRAPTALDWFLRGELAAIRDQLDDASADLARVPDDHQVAAQARLIAGQIERRRDRLRLAEEAFLAAIRLDPSLVQAHRELISIYGIQLRRPEINGEFVALQKLISLNFEDVYHWTSLRNNSWDPAVVADDLTRFVAADSSDRWSRLALAEVQRRMGSHDEAESTLAALPPEDPGANAIRVQIALDRRETEKADRLLALGRADDPTLARLRGAESLGHRDAREAVEQFRIAYAAGPDDHEVLFGFWVALELLGNDAEAKPIREAARNLDLLNSAIQRGRAPGARQDLRLIREFGALCAALQRDGEARAWYQLAIAANPLDSESQQAMFRLGAPTAGRASTPAPRP
jgi:tetratricopeptide (TPR) repeat protein